MATVIHADGATRQLVAANRKDGITLDQLQAAVGGYIEMVPLSSSEVVFCNEDGRRLGLPVNVRAPRFVGTIVVCHRSEVK